MTLNRRGARIELQLYKANHWPSWYCHTGQFLTSIRHWHPKQSTSHIFTNLLYYLQMKNQIVLGTVYLLAILSQRSWYRISNSSLVSVRCLVGILELCAMSFREDYQKRKVNDVNRRGIPHLNFVVVWGRRLCFLLRRWLFFTPRWLLTHIVGIFARSSFGIWNQTHSQFHSPLLASAPEKCAPQTIWVWLRLKVWLCEYNFMPENGLLVYTVSRLSKSQR